MAEHGLFGVQPDRSNQAPAASHARQVWQFGRNDTPAPHVRLRTKEPHQHRPEWVSTGLTSA